MANLHIIRASAGSGKTFALTGEYLSLALRDPENFRHILAVTFTNKATAEMKRRIAGELHRISQGMDSGHLMPLKAKLGIPEAELRTRAASVLQKILHNYSRFSVTTIDSFFQQIIRSFTREIGIRGGYTVELDTDAVLERSIDRLQDETARNRNLLRWLTEFASDRIEKGYGWNFRNDIYKLGQQLFNEHYKIFSKHLSEKLADKDFMNSYQHGLTRIIRSFESTLRKMASAGVDTIHAAGLVTEDFFRGSSGPAGYLTRTAAGNVSDPNAYVRKATESTEAWHTKNAARKNDIEKACREGLMKVLQEVTAYYDREIRDYRTARETGRNLFTLGILSELSGFMQDYCRENNIFLLSDASLFLHSIIDDHDAPFVYEKTGNRFHHFMIDEFQDTSLLQWDNFKPLISNGLSQDYDSLIVGDVKQSIYRWRNSSWKILAKAVESEFYTQSLAFTILEKNHRSREAILQFNNAFFASACRFMQDHFNAQADDAGVSLPDEFHDTIVRNFTDAVQRPGKKDYTGGLVRISFLESGSFKSLVEERLVSLIRNLLDKGYAAGDIAILTRKNDEAKAITDLLLNLQQNAGTFPSFRVISEETLYVSNSPSVRFLVGILKYLHSPEDDINTYFIIHAYISGLPEGSVKTEFAKLLEKANLKVIIPSELFPEGFRDLHEKAGSYSLFELVEHLIHIFGFHTSENESIYLQGFQDLILDFTHSQSSSAGDFIRFWDERGFKTPVSLPGNPDAVRVLTMHKAKGLEFPVVIIPYCTWSLADHRNRSVLWCKPEKTPFDKLGLVPVDFTARLAGTHFASAYFEELLLQYIDSLNLLYVAFTRASEALYCFSPEPAERLSEISGLVMNVLNTDGVAPASSSLVALNEHFSKSERVFEYGYLPAVSETKRRHEEGIRIGNAYPVNPSRKNLKVAFQGKIFLDATTGRINRPVSEGSLMHEIFSRIFHPGDIAGAVSGLVAEGKIREGEKEEKIRTIQSLLMDERVAAWFGNDWKISTETEFILSGQSLKRPDRVLIRGERAIVIDYKFGEKEETRHMAQVLEYRDLLLDMGYKQVEAWLWYVMLKRVVRAEA